MINTISLPLKSGINIFSLHTVSLIYARFFRIKSLKSLLRGSIAGLGYKWLRFENCCAAVLQGEATKTLLGLL